MDFREKLSAFIAPKAATKANKVNSTTNPNGVVKAKNVFLNLFNLENFFCLKISVIILNPKLGDKMTLTPS